MLFEELKKLEESVLKDGVDTQRFYEVCEAYFIAKFIDGVCLSDKETINKMLTITDVSKWDVKII